MPQKTDLLTSCLIQATVAAQKMKEEEFMKAFSELQGTCEHLRDSNDAAGRMLELIPSHSEIINMDWKLRQAVIDRLHEMK